MFTLTVTDLAKRFGTRRVFQDLNLELSTGQSLAVVGPNGSGKTTLLLTLLALHRPTKGNIAYTDDGAAIDESRLRRLTSFVAPYLTLYDHLTGEENLKFFASVGGVRLTGKRIDELLVRVGLSGRGMDLVGAYSSGMKQRLKYALALMKETAFLLLDEPGSNLDTEGKKLSAEILDQQRADCVIIIATNEPQEADLADRRLQLGG